jgi:glycosyltransferase involved in cell wall biosynthesis
MRCPSLSELPAPPPGRTGWPWTEESRQMPERMSETQSAPRVTIVTPSFNQGRFIEEAIRSILLQGYPDLEYFVLDGGSTDSTVEIIRKYSRWIDFWVSEPDRGQSAAINRGLRMGSGVYAAWINSDDMLCRNALADHFLSRGIKEDVVYIGDCVHVDELSNILITNRGRVHSFEELVRIRSVWRSGGGIDQPAVLFPLELALRVGGLKEGNHNTMDYELWGEFFLAGARVQYTGRPFGVFRRHNSQKTKDSLKQTRSLLETATALIARQNCLSAEIKHEILTDLQAYRDAYPEKLWKGSGRLARLGLPRGIVIPMRNLKVKVLCIVWFLFIFYVCVYLLLLLV